MSIRFLLLAIICSGLAQPVVAQHGDSLLVEVGDHYLDNCIKGYGKAEIVDSNGKKHLMFVPVKVEGIGSLLSFHRSEEDLRKFGKAAVPISVDKVNSLTVNGLYHEHIVLAGKRQHLLATRVANGPVELFYTQKRGMGGGPVMIGMGAGGAPMMTGGGSYTRRVWYLRRQGGELQEVSSFDFEGFVTQYFADYPALTASFNSSGKDRLEYDDLVIAVRAYNRHLLHAGSPAVGH